MEATTYTNKEDLETAAQEAARSAWREATGRDWSDRNTRTFSDRVLAEHELRAFALTRKLHEVLVAAARFAQGYQLVPGSMDVIGPDRRPLQFADTAHTRALLRFIERELPAIDSRAHDVDGTIVGVGNRPRRGEDLEAVHGRKGLADGGVIARRAYVELTMQGTRGK